MNVRGVETHVRAAGAGPDVLLLHGNPDTHRVWDAVVERLAPHHRCIAPDLPGFGASKAPRDFDCSLANQAAWVAELCDALGLARVHLVVHDVGGPYGLAFASTPKQVLWGDRDPFLPSATADRYGTDQVAHFPDYGHWVMVEDPAASAAAIASLIARSS